MAKRKWTNEEIKEYRKTHYFPGYFNKDDARIFVPKYMGIGVTFNWANPFTWIVFAGLVIVIVCARIFFKIL